MELRHLRYFVTLAEELHFRHAATRAAPAAGAGTRGARLLERTTHHVRLTETGAAFLVEARQILAQVDLAATVARDAARATPSLRVGVVDASYDSMPQILRKTQRRYPDLTFTRLRPACRHSSRCLLWAGSTSARDGRQWLRPMWHPELLRLDPLGVVVPDEHPFAGLPEPVGQLARRPLLLAEEGRAPEFNQFVIELCRSVGFTPTVFHGTVESIAPAST